MRNFLFNRDVKRVRMGGYKYSADTLTHKKHNFSPKGKIRLFCVGKVTP